jgi:phage-related protein
MNFKIVYKDGTEVDMLDDLSVKALSFDVSSPVPIHYRDNVKGRSGAIRMGKDYDVRPIESDCILSAVDNLDYPLLLDVINEALFKDEEFYLVTDNQPYKRWKVEVDNSFTFDRIVNHGWFSIPFVVTDGMSESIGTSLDPRTFDAELWGFGQMLEVDEDDYIHTTNTFTLRNIGNVNIDPRKHPLTIKYKGASSNLKIKNVTTGVEWTYTGSSTTNDTIELRRVRAYKNGLSIIGSTNKKLITLATGDNNFEITGTSGSFEISFDTRFYYL